MTEAEWLEAANPGRMLEFAAGRASDRKLRLFGVACIRAAWDRLGDDRSRRAVAAAERLADGAIGKPEALATQEEAYDVRDELFDGGRQYTPGGPLSMAEAAAFTLGSFPSPVPLEYGYHDLDYLPADPIGQTHLLRCVVGNPFRPVAVNPAWLTPTVTSLAAAIYADRAFDRLPILADALEDAGCDEPAVLSHCRTHPEHARGCWVVDAVLGKS